MNNVATTFSAVFLSACASGRSVSPPVSQPRPAASDQFDIQGFNRNQTTHVEDNDGRKTYGGMVKESSVFGEVNCAVTLGEIKRKQVNHVYTRIEWTNPADPETFLRLEKEADGILSKAGHQPSTATFSPDELAADVAGVDYFRGAPVCDYERGYLSRRLQALREPDMRDAPEGSYRFLWVRAFDLPLVVRVVGPPASATLIAKVGTVESQPPKLCLRVERALTAQQYNSLRDACSSPDVWQWSEEDLPHIKDGARWVVEARQGGRHLFGRARSPESGALRDCALRLLDIAGIPKGEVY